MTEYVNLKDEKIPLAYRWLVTGAILNKERRVYLNHLLRIPFFKDIKQNFIRHELEHLAERKTSLFEIEDIKNQPRSLRYIFLSFILGWLVFLPIKIIKSEEGGWLVTYNKTSFILDFIILILLWVIFL